MFQVCIAVVDGRESSFIGSFVGTVKLSFIKLFTSGCGTDRGNKNPSKLPISNMMYKENVTKITFHTQKYIREL